MIALSNRELRRALDAMARHHTERGTDISTTEVLIQRGGNHPKRVRELVVERLNHFGWANVCCRLRQYLATQPRILVIMAHERRAHAPRAAAKPLRLRRVKGDLS